MSVKYFSLPADCDLVVASDVHIKTSCDERDLALQNLVDAAAVARCKAFVLNGDIFDFFFGWSRYFNKKYDGLFSRLEKLAATGCQVWFVEGNHEFGMERMTTKGVRFIDGFGDVLTLKSGHKVLIVHGDLMRHDPKYLAFRSVVRSKWFNTLAYLFPQILLDKFTLWFAQTSRKKDKYRTLHHDRIIASATQRLDSSRADAMVFGHFHHPYDETTPESKKILSVDSWDKPNCLMFHEGIWTRVYGK